MPPGMQSIASKLNYEVTKLTVKSSNAAAIPSADANKEEGSAGTNYLWVKSPLSDASPQQKSARELQRAVRWTCYVSHQLSSWVSIFAAQRRRESENVQV